MNGLFTQSPQDAPGPVISFLESKNDSFEKDF